MGDCQRAVLQAETLVVCSISWWGYSVLSVTWGITRDTYVSRISLKYWEHIYLEQMVGFSHILVVGIPEAFHSKIALLLQTRKCHCARTKAWPFCSASNPVWALFQLELLSFPGANSSQAACDEKHVFVEAGTKSRTSQTLATPPQVVTLLTPPSYYILLRSSLLLL